MSFIPRHIGIVDSCRDRGMGSAGCDSKSMALIINIELVVRSNFEEWDMNKDEAFEKSWMVELQDFSFRTPPDFVKATLDGDIKLCMRPKHRTIPSASAFEGVSFSIAHNGTTSISSSKAAKESLSSERHAKRNSWRATSSRRTTTNDLDTIYFHIMNCAHVHLHEKYSRIV